MNFYFLFCRCSGISSQWLSLTAFSFILYIKLMFDVHNRRCPQVSRSLMAVLITGGLHLHQCPDLLPFFSLGLHMIMCLLSMDRRDGQRMRSLYDQSRSEIVPAGHIHRDCDQPECDRLSWYSLIQMIPPAICQTKLANHGHRFIRRKKKNSQGELEQSSKWSAKFGRSPNTYTPWRAFA